MEVTKRAEKSAQRKSNALPLFMIGAGLVVLGLLALVLLTNPGSGSGEGEAASGVSTIPVAVSFPAPEIKLTDLQDNPVSLASFPGQVVLINNWATWCPPCKAEMPTLQAYFDQHTAQGFTVVAIEAGEPVQDVADFAREYRLTFPVWPDPEQRTLAAFRTDTLPSSYVMDRDGTIRLAWTGQISRDILEQYVTPLLEE